MAGKGTVKVGCYSSPKLNTSMALIQLLPNGPSINLSRVLCGPPDLLCQLH